MLNPIENLILQFEDMCGESDTELGNEARAYYENLLALIERAFPYVDDMVGVASEARFLLSGPEILGMVRENIADVRQRIFPNQADVDDQFCLGILWNQTDECLAWWHGFENNR